VKNQKIIADNLKAGWNSGYSKALIPRANNLDFGRRGCPIQVRRIFLTRGGDFFQTKRRLTSLNSGGRLTSPQGSFAFSGPATAEINVAGKERKNHESIASV
jgi:hypothetical protein